MITNAYVTKENQTWAINRIYQEKQFSSKIMPKMRQEDLFLFFKEALHVVKESAGHLNLIFLIKLFCYMNKKSREKLKYLENEKNF